MEFPDLNDRGGLNSKSDSLPPKFYTQDRWTNSLNLRKKKINEIIFKQRGLERFKKDGNKEYEIVKENLNIEKELKNKIYDDIDIFLKEMKKNIKHENIEYNKYALYCLRSQITNNNNFNNKNYLSEELQKKDFISDILNLIQKYFNDNQIIYESLWIFINIVYFLKDPSELSLFLTNKNCINLYIKILDKKDNCLRFHIYWLISNLLVNDKFNITQEVLFHLYMSPFFRLYLFKTLEDKIQVTENEMLNIFNILSQLSHFINDTYISLASNNIQHFINYNSEVNYESIQENNTYLFHASLKYFLTYVENPKLNFYCLFGLSKLSNFLQDQQAYNEFFKSGLARKLVKEQIKLNEDCLDFITQIIGNFLSCSPDELLDIVFIEEILSFFVKLIQKYPTRQLLKRDIFWCVSNITSGNKIFCTKFAESGMLEITLQSIYIDNDTVINEALFTLLGFFDKENLDTIIKYHHLDYIKNLTLGLKNFKSKTKPGEKMINIELLERIFSCFGILFEIGELLKGNLKNKFVSDFEKNGGFEIIENILSENQLSQNVQILGEQLLQSRNL